MGPRTRTWRQENILIHGQRVTGGVARAPQPTLVHEVHRVCRIAAICARQGRGLADRTQGDGRAAARRTVVERVDHVVHNPERLVPVEGAVDGLSVRHGRF